jgi:hypothetical protein
MVPWLRWVRSCSGRSEIRLVLATLRRCEIALLL